MKHYFLDKSLKLILNYFDYNEKEIEKLKYGLEGLYLTVTKTIVIFILAIILGIVKDVIIILFLFNIIRFTGFGFHAPKSYQCLIISVISFIILPFILKEINFTYENILIISSICIISFLLFAPSDTIKRPLKNKKKRVIRKIFTVIIGIIFTACSLVFSNYSYLFITALIIEATFINPLIYTIFKEPYSNFKLA